VQQRLRLRGKLSGAPFSGHEEFEEPVEALLGHFLLDVVPGGERLYRHEVAREFLPLADLAVLDNALSQHGDADLDRVLGSVHDPAARKAISEQIRRYEHNVRIAIDYDGTPPRAKMVLLRTSSSYHRAPETMSEVHIVPGDHSTMLMPPHVDAVAAGLRDVLDKFASALQTAVISGRLPGQHSAAHVEQSFDLHAGTDHAEGR